MRPKSNVWDDISTAVKIAARKLLVADDAEELRSQVCAMLKHTTIPKPNMTQEQRTAVITLKQKDAVILNADKKVMQ